MNENWKFKRPIVHTRLLYSDPHCNTICQQPNSHHVGLASITNCNNSNTKQEWTNYLWVSINGYLWGSTTSQIFTRQIELAAQENKSIIIMGDANLCNIRWDSPGFLHWKISEELRDTLTQWGLSELLLGTTYTEDRLSEDGSEITSALDHIVVSIEFSPLCTIDLTTNWYQWHNGDYEEN